MNDIRHTLYKNTKLTFLNNKNVISNKHIKKGELLLIEHCIYNKLDLNESLKYQKEFYNNLYPFNAIWNLNILDEKNNDIINEKVVLNSFKMNDLIILGQDISNFKINNNNTNAYSWISSYNTNLTVDSIFISIIAGKDINENEEIVLEYLGDIDETKHIIIPRIIEQYFKKDIFNIITLNQISNYHGLYMIDDLLNTTQKFTDYIKNDYGDFNIDIVKEWLILKLDEIRKIHSK